MRKLTSKEKAEHLADEDIIMPVTSLERTGKVLRDILPVDLDLDPFADLLSKLDGSSAP